MQNRDIEFKDGKAILSRETYEEWRMFCRMHGETDLPAFPNVAVAMGGVITGGMGGISGAIRLIDLNPNERFIPNAKVEYPKASKEVKKLTDE